MQRPELRCRSPGRWAAVLIALLASALVLDACRAPPREARTVVANKGGGSLRSEAIARAVLEKEPAGTPYTAATIDRVWEKARYIGPKNERGGYRKDPCGAWINRAAHGNRSSQWGWEIAHLTPLSQGGTDAISNLRPLHWMNSAAQANGRTSCAVTSRGVENVTL